MENIMFMVVFSKMGELVSVIKQGFKNAEKHAWQTARKDRTITAITILNADAELVVRWNESEIQEILENNSYV